MVMVMVWVMVWVCVLYLSLDGDGDITVSGRGRVIRRLLVDDGIIVGSGRGAGAGGGGASVTIYRTEFFHSVNVGRCMWNTDTDNAYHVIMVMNISIHSYIF